MPQEIASVVTDVSGILASNLMNEAFYSCFSFHVGRTEESFGEDNHFSVLL